MSENRNRRLRNIPEDLDRGMAGNRQPAREIVPMADGGGLPAGNSLPVRDEQAEAAYQLGSKMGAQATVSDVMPDRGVIGTGGGTAPAGPAGPVGKEQIQKAQQTLMKYKTGKASVDRRIIRAQQWWKLRNWEMIQAERGTKGATIAKSSTAWLWNCIVGKHADAMDSYPEPVILPRMQEDKAEAQILSNIIPVVLQLNDFQNVYSDCQWQKMQEGTAGYYIGWDKTKLGGIGDIGINKVNLLQLFWEPGISDIQDSENLFFTRLMDNRRLEQQYPQLEGKLKSAVLVANKYRTDDAMDTSEKSVVVDWYYHTWQGERKILHYCQFVGEEIIYSTENEGMSEGLYADGDYPFVLDPLYKVEGSPAGYGYVDIGRDAQTDIDTINQAMVVNAVVTSTPRYFIQSDGAVNEDEFADWSKPFVHTNGALGETSLRQIITNGIQSNALQMLERKIEELKFVTGNNDVNNGGTPSGVTAASAIAALQEMSGRSSKDSNRSAYAAYNKIVNMVIERIRQFYDIPRQFRILGQNGQEMFVNYNNAKLQDQQIAGGMGMEPGFRKPVFDVDVRSQRENAYSKITQNELAIQFLQLGVFNPQMTDQSLMMLDMMDFKGKEELQQKVENMGTLQESLMQVAQIAMALAEKYEPGVANQLAMILQGMSQDAGLNGGGERLAEAGGLAEGQEPTGKPSDENALVRKARANVQESSRI